MCVQERRDVAVACIPNACAQIVTRGGAKQPNHNNISVIDGADASECILGTDVKVSVSCKIPGVRLGYDKI